MIRLTNKQLREALIRLTDKPLLFEVLNCAGHLYAGEYADGSLAIIVGEGGTIGKLSINLSRADELTENQFFVKLYSEGEIINPPCLKSGLFKVIGEPFKMHYGTYQKWELIGGLPCKE